MGNSSDMTFTIRTDKTNYKEKKIIQEKERAPAFTLLSAISINIE